MDELQAKRLAKLRDSLKDIAGFYAPVVLGYVDLGLTKLRQDKELRIKVKNFAELVTAIISNLDETDP